MQELRRGQLWRTGSEWFAVVYGRHGRRRSHRQRGRNLVFAEHAAGLPRRTDIFGRTYAEWVRVLEFVERGLSHAEHVFVHSAGTGRYSLTNLCISTRISTLPPRKQGGLACAAGGCEIKKSIPRGIIPLAVSLPGHGMIPALKWS